MLVNFMGSLTIAYVLPLSCENIGADMLKRLLFVFGFYNVYFSTRSTVTERLLVDQMFTNYPRSFSARLH